MNPERGVLEACYAWVEGAPKCSSPTKARFPKGRDGAVGDTQTTPIEFRSAWVPYGRITEWPAFVRPFMTAPKQQYARITGSSFDIVPVSAAMIEECGLSNAMKDKDEVTEKRGANLQPCSGALSTAHLPEGSGQKC